MSGDGWWWSADWSTALAVARSRAAASGARYRVRKSWAEPNRWLVMPVTPSERWYTNPVTPSDLSYTNPSIWI
jgi:hypothetical protein